jgi:hypothetical protein
MKTLDRRLLRLESVAGRRVCRDLSDAELDAALATALADWLAADPDACPRNVEAGVLAFVDAPDAEGTPR